MEIILKSTEKLHDMKYSASKGKCKSRTSDLAVVPDFDKLILKRMKYSLTWAPPNHLPSMDHYTGFLHTIVNDSLDLFPPSKFAYKESLSLITL